MRGIATIILMIFFLGNLLAQTSPCQPPTAYTTLDVNNVRAGLLNAGDFWWDLHNAQYEVPKGSGIHSILGGGFWIGGIDQGGKLHMAAQTYRQSGTDFWPGPLGVTHGGTEPVCLAYDRFWEISEADIIDYTSLCDQYLKNASDTIPSNLVAKDILEWPAEGNKYARGYNGVKLDIPNGKKLAPYMDVDGISGYNPLHGDIPKLRGEKAIWWVFNDIGGEHGETGGEPLGVEVSVMAYGYNWPAYLQNTTFYHFEAVNYGNSLHHAYLGFHIDFDIGYPFDDYVGCDSVQSLGIGYNGEDNDGFGSLQGYGPNPPFLGVDLLRGPKGDDGNPLPMTSFMTYLSSFAAVGNPTQPLHFYNYLRARWLDSSHLTWGGDGYGGTQNVNFIFPTDPGLPGWSQCNNNYPPSDQRMIIGTGPFTFGNRERISFDLGVIWRKCDPQPWCPSFSCIRVISAVTQAWFDNYFPPVGIQDRSEPTTTNLKIHPNPVQQEATIRWTKELHSEAILNVYDIRGELIKKFSVNAGQKEQHISLIGLEGGVYLIQLITKEGHRQSSKLMVTH